MSIFMWRLISNRIPVDRKLQWRNISLASKCYCCPNNPRIESLQHLFVQGRGAHTVWMAFDGWFPGSSENLRWRDSIPDRLEKWARRVGQNGTSHLSRIIPYLICWFLWAERNYNRQGRGRFNSQNVIWQVLNHLKNLASIGKLGPPQWAGCSPPSPLVAVARVRQNLHPQPSAQWLPPELGWTKVNVFGCSLAGPSGCAVGGILRNNSGDLLGAFTHPWRNAQRSTHVSSRFSTASPSRWNFRGTSGLNQTRPRRCPSLPPAPSALPPRDTSHLVSNSSWLFEEQRYPTSAERVIERRNVSSNLPLVLRKAAPSPLFRPPE